MSAWLDAHLEVLDGVAKDLRGPSVKATGRYGMTAESVLRCALLKQYRQLSYEELAFHLLDSASFQAFARLPMDFIPKKSALQLNISAITGATWEAINRRLLRHAQKTRAETGKMMRVDSTAIDAPIHEPSDNTLLWDAMRIMVRLLYRAQELSGAPELIWRNHSRVAKKRARTIRYIRGKEKRVALYKDLVRVSEDTLGYVRQALLQLTVAHAFGIGFEQWLAQVEHYTPLIERVIDQTKRRVFAGEKVPAREKVLSLFEEHTEAQTQPDQWQERFDPGYRDRGRESGGFGTFPADGESSY